MATINGTTGNDSLVGTSSADLITALDGDDTIAWSTGLDTIQGGAGRDRLVVGAASVTATLNDDLTVTLNGSFLSVPGPVTPGTTFTNILSGVEEIGLQSFSRDTGFQDYTLTLVAGTHGNDIVLARQGVNERFVLGRGNDTVSYENWTTGVSAGADSDVENLTGSAQNDLLIGNNLANILVGGRGNDTLQGVGGNDWLTGGEGTDTAQIFGDSTGWTANRDVTGQNIVLWKGSEFYILNGIETIQFNDKTFSANAAGDFNLSGASVPTQVGPLEVRGTAGDDVFTDLSGTKHYFGGDGVDTVRLSSASTEWNLSKTLDGTGTLIWKGDDFRVLNQMEKITFTDKTLYLNGAGTQHIVATEANTAFVVGESSTGYGYGKTLDGTGIVVWKGAEFDVLNNVDQIIFTDKVVLASEFGL